MCRLRRARGVAANGNAGAVRLGRSWAVEAVPGHDSPQPSRLARWYECTVLRFPSSVLALYAAAALFFGYHLKDFRLDASSESLVLENDADLAYYERTRELFGTDDYVILAISLKKGALDEGVLRRLDALSAELRALPDVDSVTSVLTVPLFESPKVSLYEIGSKYRILLSPDCDRRMALRELASSPLWRNNLLSADGATTAVVLTLRPDRAYDALGEERYRHRQKRASG